MIKNSFILVFTISSMLAIVTIAHAGNEPVRHIVAVKYKDEATEEQIQQVTKAFRGLQDKIPGIVSFEDGVNNSREERNNGFTHVYLVTFEDANARDEYLPHPEHKKLVKLVEELGILDDVFSVSWKMNGSGVRPYK